MKDKETISEGVMRGISRFFLWTTLSSFAGAFLAAIFVRLESSDDEAVIIGAIIGSFLGFLLALVCLAGSSTSK